MSEPTWVHVPPLSAYTRTWPASCRCRRSYLRRSPRACRPRTSIPSTRTSRPQPRRRCLSPPGSTSRRSQRTRARGRRAGAVVTVAPIATRVPSEDIDTDHPDSSSAASPSMSEPTWVHVPPLSAYTRTWPASEPVPSLPKRRSPRACRPRTSIPIPGLVARSLAVDVGPPGSTSRRSQRTRARGRRDAVAVVPYAPIATRVPSEDIDTETRNSRSQPRRRYLSPPGSKLRPNRGSRVRRRGGGRPVSTRILFKYLNFSVELLSYVTATNPLFEITDPPWALMVATGCEIAYTAVAVTDCLLYTWFALFFERATISPSVDGANLVMELKPREIG